MKKKEEKNFNNDDIKTLASENGEQEEQLTDFDIDNLSRCADMIMKKDKKGGIRALPQLSWKQIKEYVMEHKGFSIICFLYVISLINTFIVFYHLLNGIVFLKVDGIPLNPFYNILGCMLPFYCFIFSTFYDLFNYHSIKKAAFMYDCINLCLICGSMFYACWQKFFVPLIRCIRPTQYLTNRMLDWLAIMAGLFIVIPLVYIFYRICKDMFQEQNMSLVLAFKMNHYIDTRRHPENFYDIRCIKNLETGRLLPIREIDRFTQMVADGPSGTGKTSLILIKAIQGDIEQKAKNRRKREAAYLKMVSAYEAEVVSSRGDRIHDWDVRPLPGFEKKFKKIQETYPDCGITVFAPNDDLTDDVVDIAKAWGFDDADINRIDPARSMEGKVKDCSVGSNMFSLSPAIEKWRMPQEIATIGSNFSDILETLSMLKGNSDSYFTGIMRACAENISMLCMLAVPLVHKRDATLSDIASILSDFDMAAPLLSRLDEDDENRDNYAQMMAFIQNELLGEGRKEMYSQARGVRNLVNDMLNIPDIKRVLCADKSIDWDYALARGQITVVNFGRALGAGNSTAFGLNSLLCFNQAVLRRPGKTKDRLRHFSYVDELTYLVSPTIEDNISFFRQYRVAFVGAYQTMDQFKKTKVTEYLAGIVQTVGTHIIFGRVNATEMEMYKQMAGKKVEIIEQDTKAHTSYAEDDPSSSSSTRTTPTEMDALDVGKMRKMDFREVTVFTQQDGRVLDVKFGKLHFLTNEQKHPTESPLSGIPWSRLTSIPRDQLIRPEEEDEVSHEPDAALAGKAGSKIVTQGMDAEPESEMEKKENQPEKQKTGDDFDLFDAFNNPNL